MGTFSITRPIAIGSKSGAEILRESDNASSDAALLLAILGDQNAGEGIIWGAVTAPNVAVGGLIRFQFDQNTAIISLDGGSPINFNSLPSGFTPTSAIMSFLYQTTAAPTSIVLQFDQNTQSAVFDTPSAILPASFRYDFGRLPQPTMLDIINNGFGIAGSFGTTNDFLVVSNFALAGTYEIQRFSFDNVIIQDTTNVEAGDKVQIDLIPTSPDPVVPDVPLSSVVAVILEYTDAQAVVNTITILAQDFLIWWYYQIVFYMPRFRTPVGPISVYLVGNGTQFSGSVLLGTMTVVFTDASGIYVLVPGKTTDTIYNPARDGTTSEVNIPDPIIKTAFIP